MTTMMTTTLPTQLRYKVKLGIVAMMVVVYFLWFYFVCRYYLVAGAISKPKNERAIVGDNSSSTNFSFESINYMSALHRLHQYQVLSLRSNQDKSPTLQLQVVHIAALVWDTILL
jgi:hypothetical protein